VTAPLATIIVRTQGRRPLLLSGALASLARQSHPALEVIVVEDGGDIAADVVHELARSGARADLFRHLSAPKGGRSRTGNLGLETSRGAFLGFLDEDDELHPNHIEALIALLANDGDLAYARAQPVFCDGLTEDRPIARSVGEPEGDIPFSRTLLWLRNSIPIQAALFRRNLYERCGGLDPSLDALEDWDLWIRYSAERDFVALDDITSCYRLPASQEALERRARIHEVARSAVMAKHAELAGRHKFADIAALPAIIRAQTSFRQSVSKAGAELAAKLFGRSHNENT
jgi:glycosyltransferase involved in cell wall biosynthesis